MPQSCTDTSGGPRTLSLLTNPIWRRSYFWFLIGTVSVIGGISSLIGEHAINIRFSEIILLPVIYAVVLGLLISGQTLVPLPSRVQKFAGAMVGPLVALFLARLGFLVGPSLGELGKDVPALILQELGNGVAAMVIALPIAVIVLGLGREGFGAGFSLDREAMIGVITEKFGARSPEYRGVISTYVVGIVLGAVVVSIVASLLAAAGFLSPLALALGSGIGSASMMLAGVASLQSVYPGDSDQISAYAAAANAIGAANIYIGTFISLPIARLLYRPYTRLAALVGHKGPAVAAMPTLSNRDQTESDSQGSVKGDESEAPNISLWGIVSLYIVFLAVMGLVQFVAQHELTPTMMIGLSVLGVLAFASIMINRVLPWLPYSVIVVGLGTLLSSPVSAFAADLEIVVEKIDFITLGVPVLALIGLSVGDDAKALGKNSWRLVLTGLIVIISAFILASIVGYFALTYLHL